jgi:hypothetical protein
MAFLGYPNVRAAQEPDEKTKLDQRFQVAHDDVKMRSCEPVLDQFEDAVSQSKAVICRPWGVLTKLSENGNELFMTFYRQLKVRDRLPEDSYFDRARLAVDSTFFPYYHEQINFAALSLNGTGPTGYGECSLVFREDAISHRTTVFEENILVFCEKHVIPTGQKPPAGYRAVWEDRHRLAAAKLYGEIDDQTEPNSFSAIILKQKGGTAKDEFMEAHIYGTLDLLAVERFIAPKPKRKADQVLANRFKRKLREAGAKIENV